MATKLVKKIYYCRAKDFDTVGYPFRGRVKLFPTINWHEVDMVTEQSKATLSVNSVTENRQKFYLATLKFNTCQFVQDTQRLVYLVVYTNGEQRVIGGKHQPYCVTEFVDDAPESVTDNQLLTINVTYKSPYFIPFVAV